jgi:hypothetical protein
MTKFLARVEMTHLPHEWSSPQVKDARHAESGLDGAPGTCARSPLRIPR